MLGGDQLEVGNEVLRDSGHSGKSGVLFTLADGGVAGVKASECAASCNSEFSVLLSDASDISAYDENDAKHKLGEGLKRANELLLQLAETEDGADMVCSMGAIWFCKDYAIYTQVGNVRIYRFSDGVLEQLTDEHTEAWELVKQGKITPEKAMTYPGNRVLTQLLGRKGGKQPNLDIDICKVEAGDCFLMCSDGVSHYLQDRRIEEIFSKSALEDGVLSGDLAKQILDSAIAASEGADHASVIVAQVFPKVSRWTEMIRDLEAIA